MDKKHRLKKFFQKPVVQDAGKAASSGLVEALKQADGIATFVPVPALKLALQSLLTLIQAVDQTAQNSDAAKRLQNRIESLTTSILVPIEQVDLKDMPKELVIELDRLAKIFEISVTNCRVKISHGWFRRFIRREDDQGDVANMSKAIDEAIAQFLSVGTIKSVGTIVQVKQGVDELREQNQIKQIISKKAENANHLYQSAQSAQRSKCLEGTRVTVLEQIRAFLKDTVSVNLFWLSGIAGSGKSTIAQSAAVEATLLSDCIVASFFFSQRGHTELCDASFVFPTLAYQFSLADAGFRKHVSEIIKEQPDIFEKDYTQYKSLIVEPLKAMNCTQRRIFIVLDAFDECEPRGATAILNALLDKKIGIPKELKVLTTSRPEAHIREVFYARDDIRKLNLQDIEAKRDIHHYLLTTFKRPPITLATPFNAGDEVIFKLAESAGDSFIYAASILRFIFDEHDQHPQRRLDILLGNRTDPEERPYERLDTLYLSILHQAVPFGASRSIKRRLRTVLGQLVTFREPLPMVVMENFCELEPGDIKRALHYLHSLIQVPNSDNQAPLIYHLSFSDFIIDSTRCRDGDLVVDVNSAEREVLLSCFGHLSSQLHRNMAGIEDPSLPHSEIDSFQTKVENAVSPELRYACQYWTSHLMKTEVVDDDEMWPRLRDFLTRCLLWWIETMALLDTLREAAESMSQVRAWMTSLKGEVGDGSSLLADLVNDAFRFLSYHADTISFNALHVYHSALPFTPTETQLRKMYAHELETSVKASQGVDPGWDPTMMVMRCNQAPVWGISWSPNGRFIAAAGSKSIEIRDTLIGSSVVSIDLPKPLFYLSSYVDEARVEHRLKKLVQMPAIPIEGWRVESRLVKALKHAEDIASLVPFSGLKNVLGSFLALVRAGYNTGGQSRAAGMKGLESRIKSFTEVVLVQIKEKESSDIPCQVTNGLEELTRTIEAIAATCRQTLSQGNLERFADGTDGVKAYLNWKVSISYSRISDAIKQFMERETTQLLENDVEVKRTIEPIVSEKTKNPNLSTHAQRAECLEGTRVAVLDEIFAWLKDPSGARIFWLSGIAGSGKSAIAQSASISAALLDGHIVISTFFSQFGYAGLCDPSSVFQTLAFQFSLLDADYKERVAEVISKHPDIFEKNLRFQYEKLIIEPLGAMRQLRSCILITLDGLDECEPHGATAFLKVLLAEDIDHPKELKILTASRPEAHLCKTFDDQRDIRKLRLEDFETDSDIRHYLRTSFEQPPSHFVFPFTVSEGTISKLAKQAGSSFVYAATIVRFIFDEHFQDPRRRIDYLLSNRADLEEHPFARLDALFLGILQQALPLGAGDDEMCRLRTVLGLLVCFREPLPTREIETFYELEPGEVEKALRHLQALVQVPSFDGLAPHIYYRSFTEFIIDPARCPDRSLVVDTGSIEKRIFNRCSSLCNLWQQRVGNGLGANDSRADDRRSTSPVCSTQEQYACLYWASHLTNIEDVDESTQYHLDDRCLLRWIETMAQLGMLREAVAQIVRVRDWITSLKRRADKAPSRLVDLMDNAFRLLLTHATTISHDSLLIYDSAIFTSATKFQLRVVEVKRSPLHPSRSFSFELSIRSELEPTLMTTFQSFYDFTLALAWSPDSQHIAMSRVNGIEVRDVLSGSVLDSFDFLPSLERVLDPKRVSCRCLAFYPNNSRIAYVTSGEVHVRNTLEKMEEFVVTGHEEGLVSINLSPSGKLLVSASKSGRIQVCDAENGDLLWAVETDTKLKSTSISPNGRFIVSLSYSRNHGVQIWNANDGRSLSILPHDVISVSFSPDSNQLASIDQSLVRVWGVPQMPTEPIQEWRASSQLACLFFLADDGYQLATATGENVYILRRDASDVATLNGHTSLVSSLAFSADGLTLASGSLDGTIRVWDTSSAGIGSSSAGNNTSEEWDFVRWSPRGRALMAFESEASSQGQARGRPKVWIWNTQDGTSRVLEDSLDGSRVAISDCGRYIGVYSWNPKRITTRRIALDVAQSNSFSFSNTYCNEFFPNSTRFAATVGNNIFTWDASVAHPEVTRLAGHSREVNQLYFVPDGSRLLSRARDSEEIFVWNVDTLQLMSRTGDAIPRYHTPTIGVMEDNWVVMILPDHGGDSERLRGKRSGLGRRLFRLPSGYQPQELWKISASWWSKHILIRRGNGSDLFVDFSALPTIEIPVCADAVLPRMHELRLRERTTYICSRQLKRS
ncbi:hypothetical protein H4582DRAFT_117919 [Lactarius indigo]|nr:hypothetical protein H4582DRAFT_117919 [Lactarius indigo]